MLQLHLFPTHTRRCFSREPTSGRTGGSRSRSNSSRRCPRAPCEAETAQAHVGAWEINMQKLPTLPAKTHAKERKQNINIPLNNTYNPQIHKSRGAVFPNGGIQVERWIAGLPKQWKPLKHIYIYINTKTTEKWKPMETTRCFSENSSPECILHIKFMNILLSNN